MSVRMVSRCGFASSIVVLGAMMASAGTFIPPTRYGNFTSSVTPSGIPWSAVATGTALPIRTSGSLNGAPGAVVYFDVETGLLQFDPKGLDVSTLIITYTTGTVNVSGTNPGPFQYTSGTGVGSYSDVSGTERTFPAKNPASSGLEPTTQAARVALTAGPPLSALLNVGSNPNSASTNGFWNVGWAFPSDLIVSGSVASIVQGNFKTIGQGANANANILGYGSQQSVFQYTINGVTGNQVGAVVPLPEPSTIVLSASSVVIAGLVRWQRARRPGGPGRDG